MLGKKLWKTLSTSVLVSVASCGSAPAPAPVESPTAVSSPIQSGAPGYVRGLRCLDQTGEYIGSGFITSNGRIATARHVIQNRVCSDLETGRILFPVQIDAAHDLVIAQLDTSGMTVAQLSCQRYVSGNPYYALGYPYFQFDIRILIPINFYSSDTQPPIDGPDGTTEYWPGMRGTRGEVSPGASGGPIIDAQTEAVHGIVNTGNAMYTFSYELADTVLCHSTNNPRSSGSNEAQHSSN